tara:strand:- start:150 stop:647 length:498 start_codon:yes stop_codon:yes gene_type:complete
MPLYFGRVKEIVRIFEAKYNEKEMKLLSQKLASLCDGKEFITLNGDVGAGKTSFARFFINFFNKNISDIPSPTFNLVFTYPTKLSSIWHFDLYRLNKEEDVWEIGMEDALENGIVLIEWPEIIKKLLPLNRLEIYFDFYKDNPYIRNVKLVPYGIWQKRLLKIDY